MIWCLTRCAGSGTTGKMALSNDREFIGIDISAEYIEIARVRLATCNLQVNVEHAYSHRQFGLGPLHSDSGYAYSHGVKDHIPSHFPENSLGIVTEYADIETLVFLPGQKQYFFVDRRATCDVNVYKTGKGYTTKICNMCFVLKPIEELKRIKKIRRVE